MLRIDFNIPHFTGNETKYIHQAVKSRKISGDGAFTKKCSDFFEKNYHFKKALLTTSCTDALEMAAILADIKPGDEVIVPSFTFVSTANAFALRGAKIIFADSESSNPNLDAEKIESLVTKKTKAIVPVHYAGVACNMDKIMKIAAKHKLLVIEDAAQAVDSYYKKQALGSIGTFGAFSFHETKNVISGEGGMLTVNSERYIKRAEIIREKGTNRSAFFRGEVDKYGWVDIGSSFLPSEIISAFLFAQLENLNDIQSTRKKIWHQYHDGLRTLQKQGKLQLPFIPGYATNNAHMFYVLCKDGNERSGLIKHLKKYDIHAFFHYISLHTSPFYAKKYSGPELPNSDRYTDCLLRLPFYYSLKRKEVEEVCKRISDYYKK